MFYIRFISFCSVCNPTQPAVDLSWYHLPEVGRREHISDCEQLNYFSLPIVLAMVVRSREAVPLLPRCDEAKRSYKVTLNRVTTLCEEENSCV